MSRIGCVCSTILPSVLAGGLLFGSAPGHADAGAPDAAMGSGILAQADPRPRTRSWGTPGAPVPPTPPVPGVYPAPPVPPLPPRHRHGHGVSISIHDGKIELDGVAEMVGNQLDRVAELLDNLPDVPPDVRDRVRGRVQSARQKLGARLSKLKSMDLEKLGPEMERMGDEIEKELEGMDKDLEQLGGKLGKHFAEKFGKDFAKSFGPNHLGFPGPHDRDNSDGDDDDDDDDDKAAVTVLPDTQTLDPSDTRAAIADLKNLSLDQSQRAQLARLRAESDRQVADAKRELETMSDRLHDTLGDVGASEADITRQIDLISEKEATIRKARILAWVRARAVLDKDQRKRVEAAAKKSH
jgi:hypothetical protein